MLMLTFKLKRLNTSISMSWIITHHPTMIQRLETLNIHFKLQIVILTICLILGLLQPNFMHKACGGSITDAYNQWGELGLNDLSATMAFPISFKRRPPVVVPYDVLYSGTLNSQQVITVDLGNTNTTNITLLTVSKNTLGSVRWVAAGESST